MKVSGRTLLACLVAWLVPGGGHFYLGRRLRGAVFCVIVLTTFSLGLAFEGRPSVIDGRPFVTDLPRADDGVRVKIGRALDTIGIAQAASSPLSTLQVFADLGVGPLDGIARRAILGEVAYFLPPDDEGSTPKTPVGLELRRRTESAKGTYGTAYLWTAGLMNILLMLDAFDIAIGRKG